VQHSAPRDPDGKKRDRVVVENRVKCGACTPCAHGRDEFCERQKRLGGELDGWSRAVLQGPAVNLQRIPTGWDSKRRRRFPSRSHRVALPDRAVAAPAVGGRPDPGGRQWRGESRTLIAKGIGARVIATAGSDWKLEKAKALGADEVINYTTTPKFSERVKSSRGRGVDVVFDCVGASVWDESLASLKPGGRLVITGTTSGSQIPFNLSTCKAVR